MIIKPFLQELIKPFIPSTGGSAAWSPSAILSNLIQWFDPAYSESLVDRLPILTPKEAGSLAIPRGQRCALFDGSNDYGVTAGALATTNQCTISLWFNSSDVTTSRRLISNRDGSNNGFDVYLENGLVSFYSVTTSVVTSVAPTLSTNTWYHLAITVSATEIKWYINGVLNNTVVGSMVASNNVCRLGAYVYYHAGKMYDARVYAGVKTAGEVAAIYNQHLTPNDVDTTGLVAAWSLQEESGLSGFDWSGNGNHLTLTNITQSTFHATDSGVKWNYNNSIGHTPALAHENLVGNAWTNVTVLTDPIVGDGYVEFMYTTTDQMLGLATLAGLATIKSGSAYGSMSFAYDPQTNGGAMFEGLTQTGTATATTIKYGDVVRLERTGSTVVCKINGVLKYTFVGTSSADLYPCMSSYQNAAGGGNAVMLNVNGVKPGSVQILHSSRISYLPIPAKASDITKDVLGGTLGVTGPIQYPAVVTPPCVTGNGTDVIGTITNAAELQIVGNLTISFYLKLAATGQQFLIDKESASGWTGEFAVSMTTQTKLAITSGNALNAEGSVASSTTLATGTWYHVAVTRSGTTHKVYLNGIEDASGTVATTPATTTSNIGVLGRLLYSMCSSASISELRIYSAAKSAAEVLALANGTDDRTSLVSHWPLQEGPGSASTNRTSYDTQSNNDITWSNGTVSLIWANRCAAARDWCTQQGGGLVSGVCIPGLVGSGNDAAGNAKTLSAGKHGNPYTRVMPNYWGAPELANIGVDSSDELSPSNTYESITTGSDNGFSRNGVDGTDRYFATREPLTGTDLTAANTYTT